MSDNTRQCGSTMHSGTYIQMYTSCISIQRNICHFYKARHYRNYEFKCLFLTLISHLRYYTNALLHQCPSKNERGEWPAKPKPPIAVYMKSRRTSGHVRRFEHHVPCFPLKRNTEKTHNKYAKCPPKIIGMSAIYHVMVGQNVRCFKKFFIYTALTPRC